MPLILQMWYDFSWHLRPPLAVAISHRCLNNQGHPWWEVHLLAFLNFAKRKDSLAKDKTTIILYYTFYMYVYLKMLVQTDLYFNGCYDMSPMGKSLDWICFGFLSYYHFLNIYFSHLIQRFTHF